jgi:hypothetical protein
VVLTYQAFISVELIVMQMDFSCHASESMFGSQEKHLYRTELDKSETILSNIEKLQEV